VNPGDLDDISRHALRARASRKWDLPGRDLIAAGVAETDLGTAPAVVAALREAVEAMDFGHMPPRLATALGEACAAWHEQRYGWAVPPEDIHPLPDVLRGLELAIEHFTAPGSAVIVPTPAFPAFITVPPTLGRRVLEVPLVPDGQGGSGAMYDLDALEAAHRAGGRLLVLCNPHNPTGRVHGVDELRAITAVVDRHGGRVLADEVHAPLTYPGHPHVPYAASSPEAAAHAITVTSASKGWNIAGLKCAQLMLTNPADRATWRRIVGHEPLRASNLGLVANTAAYTHGGPWLDGLLVYLDGNRQRLATLVADLLPEVEHQPPEGTYLAWLDFRGTGLAHPGLLFALRAGIMLLDGRNCGAAGAGWVRLNFATPRPVLVEMVERMGATHAATAR
jgi:cystathionine beta-lyase